MRFIRIKHVLYNIYYSRGFTVLDIEKSVLFGSLSFLAASVLAVAFVPIDFFYSPYERLNEPQSVSMTVNEIGIATDALEKNLAINKSESKYTYENIRDQGLKEFKNVVGFDSGTNTIPHITKADNLGDDVMESTNQFIDELNAAQKTAQLKNQNLLPKEETKADRFIKAAMDAPKMIMGDDQPNQINLSDPKYQTELNEIN